MLHASLGALPDAKPWYAQSKKGRCFFFVIRELISPHWDSVGSIPVGLWAQAWRRKQLEEEGLGVGG